MSPTAPSPDERQGSDTAVGRGGDARALLANLPKLHHRFLPEWKWEPYIAQNSMVPPL
jgi:hypothetical protein